MKYPQAIRHFVRAVAVIAAVPLLTAIVFVGQGKVLTAGLVDLVFVVLIANRWGFIQTVIASTMAAACLDYFYMPPIFSLYERDPQDWISSGMFVADRRIHCGPNQARRHPERKRADKVGEALSHQPGYHHAGPAR